ncbi:hypothetical protein CTI12_AA209690 [Artemisia annua]|uniref:Late embryogenesis abundant protein, LEA-14 n=1 Tax=Artemisia annua TaxID=35608 RepID=A0A2U1P025_ARTAN|nr:hypothetical protein CTI12_AA209690 [Artemisia annua]
MKFDRFLESLWYIFFSKWSSPSSTSRRDVPLCEIVDNQNSGSGRNHEDDSNQLLDSHELIEAIEDGDNLDLNNNESVNDDEHVPLPKKRKVCFFYSYSTFLILYLLFFLVTAFTYPLKPVCHIDYLYLPVVQNKEKTYVADLSLKFHFINRNKLIPISYDSLNITIYYLPSGPNEIIYFANSIAPGFNQSTGNSNWRAIDVPAPALSSLLQLRGTLRVNLEFDARFHCRFLCKHIRSFFMTADIQVSWTPSEWFEYEDGIIMSEKSS